MTPMNRSTKILFVAAVALALVVPAGELSAQKPAANAADSYAKYVWPAPPDKPRIRLTAILKGRPDVEAVSNFSRLLLGASPQGQYDWLQRPFAVKFDRKGRLLVTDTALGALIRFDRKGRKMDVFGTNGAMRLKAPLGLTIGPDDTIYVADAGLQKVVAFDADGNVKTAFGRQGDLTNPTGVAISPDGATLYVADSKAQRIAIFDVKSAALVKTFGHRGEKEGEFNFPTSVTFSRQGELLVVDQINARIEVFSATGEYLDTFGQTGVGFGNFVRPKDVALDDDGLIYVTDAAFGNVQIFTQDLTLLTFVGENGTGPGQFQIASGVATHGDEFAVVDQLGKRVQVFRFIVPRGER